MRIRHLVAAVGAVLCAVLVRAQDFVGQAQRAERPAETTAVGV